MSDELLNELDAMTAALEEPVGTPPADPPPTDPPQDPPIEDDPPQDPPPEDPPADPPPAEDPKDVEIRMLREQVATLSKPADPPPATPEPEPEPEVTFQDQDFMEGIDMEEITRDPKILGGLLNKVYQSGMKSSTDHFSKVVKKAMEDVVKSIPSIVKNNITSNAQATAAREKFYKDNPDLEAWRPSVAAVFAEVAAANQNKKFEEIMELTAVETRKRLGLKKEVKPNNPNPPRLPGVKKGNRGNIPPDLTAMQKEMDAMDQALGL